MRRFSSAKSRTSPIDAAPDAPLSASTHDTGGLITAEDGDLWQPIPVMSQRSDEPPIPVFLHQALPPAEQENLRWELLLKDMGFVRVDQDVPLGFEDFDWNMVFPADREDIATLLEPLVARGDDLQAAINDMSSR